MWAISSVRRAPALQAGVTGSNPVSPTIFGVIAQLGERLPCTQEVCGSIP